MSALKFDLRKGPEDWSDARLWQASGFDPALD